MKRKTGRPRRLGKKAPILGVPIREAELKRFCDLMPNHCNSKAEWARQLIAEGLDRLEAQKLRRAAAVSA